MYLLEGLVVDEASRILGYVELTLLDVLAKLPTMDGISLSPPVFSTRLSHNIHGRRLSGSDHSDLLGQLGLVSPYTRLRRLVVIGSASSRIALRKRHG